MPLVQATYMANAALTANTVPSNGYVNRYNASSGALSVTLPALSGLNDGANFTIEKDVLDTTLNTVTFTRTGSDTFDDGATNLVLSTPGEKKWIQVVTVSSTKYWKVVSGTVPKSGLSGSSAQFSLSNSTTATTIATTTLPAANLFAGSTFRIDLLGTVKVKATSGTLTFTPYIQNTALNTIQMASQTSAEGPVGFHLQIFINVRTTGVSGTAIAHGHGFIKFATNSMLILTSTNTSTTTIDTTTAAASTALLVKATWATADTNNALAIETATIERVV